MAVQNLVSAPLTSELKTDIAAKLADIKSKLGFLLSLDGDHPGIMPGVFDLAEFKKDYHLAKDLHGISNQINELAETLGNTPRNRKPSPRRRMASPRRRSATPRKRSTSPR